MAEAEERRVDLIAIVGVSIGITFLIWIGEECVPTHEDRIGKHNARCEESFVDDIQARDNCCQDTKYNCDRTEECANGAVRIILEEIDKTNNGSGNATKTKEKIKCFPSFGSGFIFFT